ncbi:rRNA maturation RNase YbeY [Sphingomonas sp. ASV193]|uniref:rRNA maturation RNase YbeY n=1 Tax=Sphingomonas sp. ASV193 TaxID=3144405 RepID=UPI0032E90F59
MTLDIILDADPEWDSSTDWDDLARRAAAAAVAESAFPQFATGEAPTEISIRLGDDEEVRALNAEWRDKDKPTNVLSFPMADAAELAAPMTPPMLGDIILARGVCEAEAADKGIAVADHAAHLIAHGTLHLLGYDHHDDEEAADMEARETRALARLGIADPYAGEAR